MKGYTLNNDIHVWINYNALYHRKRNGVRVDLDGTEEASSVASPHEGSKKKAGEKHHVDLVMQERNGFTTDWGPVGFKKKLHPLSIMVCTYTCTKE